MKRTLSFTLFVSVLFSCQEEIDTINPSFYMAFGSEGRSWDGDLIERDNGNLIIVGNFLKPANISCRVCEPIDGPFIIEADPNGFQLKFRNFYFTEATLTERAQEYMVLYNIPDLSGDMKVSFDQTGAWFNRIIQLKNGNFLALGSVPGVLGNEISNWFDFLMILDPQLDLIEFRFFHNSSIEFQDRPYGRYFGAQLLSPIELDNEDIIILMDDVKESENYYEGYSIYRLSNKGEIKQIWDFTIDPTPPPFAASSTGFAADWALDTEGNVVVYGLKGDLEATKENEGKTRDNNLFVSRIDLSTGAVIKTTIFARGNYAFAWNGGIQLSSNGFVVSDYHLDTVGEDYWDPDGDGFRNFFGGLWFLNQDLDSIGKRNITPSVVDQLQGNLIRTRDLGYVQCYRQQTQSGSEIRVVKTDTIGNVIWTYIIEGVSIVSKIIETGDGGIAILFSNDFDSMGPRVKILKLTSDGKL